ncbi:MAG: hypothetical protein WD491_15305 [Balneolales bacterium]
MSKVTLVLLNTLTLTAVIILNALAGTGEIGDNSVGDVSQKYDTMFTPAGYAFSIWGFIYLLLAGFVIFQWVALSRKDDHDIINQTGAIFIVSNLANAGWLFLWLNEYIGLSVLAILFLLFSLIALVSRLKLEIWDAPVRILIFVWWPFAIYFGWIIVATVANIAAFLTTLNWDGSPLSPQTWTIILILAATAIYLLLIFTRNLRESALVGIWAFVAIGVRHGSTNLEITVTAGIGALILLAAILYHGYLNRSANPWRN